MKTDTFSINLKQISCGNCHLELDFGSFVLPYNASYIGDEPISSLIETAYALQTYQYDLLEDSDEYEPTNAHEIIWMDEPGYLRLHFSIPAGSSDLTIKIAQNLEDTYGIDDCDYEANEEQREIITMPKKLFFDAAINAALQALKRYGICGFNRNWCDGSDTFPLHTLLQLLGADQKLKEVENEDGLKSDVFEELERLQTILKQV